jgi:SAM-dependent methyltransferase
VTDIPVREATGVHDPAAYGDAFADVYDEWYAGVSDVEGTVAAVRRLAAGGPVLEVGIGTGRLAVPLRDAGVEVHGVDSSHAMVERLRAKPGGAGIPVLVADAGAQLPEVDGGFAVVLVAFNTFFNLTADGAQEGCLKLIASRLQRGGKVVIEAFVPADNLATSGVDVTDVHADEVRLSVFRHDVPTGVVLGSMVSLSATGGVRLRPWAVRPRTPEQLDALAAAAGFEVESRRGGWRGEAFDDRSDRHVTVYRFAGSTVGAVKSS